MNAGSYTLDRKVHASLAMTLMARLTSETSKYIFPHQHLTLIIDTTQRNRTYSMSLTQKVCIVETYEVWEAVEAQILAEEIDFVSKPIKTFLYVKIWT